MNEKLQSMPRDTDREAAILAAAYERYGEGALFTYVPDRDPRPYTMTLEQAMLICGPMIVLEPEESLWDLLDKWRSTAKKIEEMSENVRIASLELGKNAVLRAQSKD